MTDYMPLNIMMTENGYLEREEDEFAMAQYEGDLSRHLTVRTETNENSIKLIKTCTRDLPNVSHDDYRLDCEPI
jgi:hypothetical protein